MSSSKQQAKAEVEVEVESDDEEQVQMATKGRKVIVILDMAQLETVKTKKGDFQLLNCDDHISIMKRNNKDPSLYRPDILHQVGDTVSGHNYDYPSKPSLISLLP